MKIERNLLKCLMEVGYMAANTKRLKAADIIFNGLVAARPQSPYPQFGLGYVAICRGKFHQAMDIFKAAPVKTPRDYDMCQGYIGMTLKLAGQTDEAHTVLTQLQTEGQNEEAVRIARKLLADM